MSVGIEYLFDLCKRKVALFSYIIEMVSIQQNEYLRGTEKRNRGESDRERVLTLALKRADVDFE